MPRFGLEKAIGLKTRTLAFGYFLGVMLGDMSKRPQARKDWYTMQVMLKLSQHRQSNLRFGNFVASCAGLIGIRMNRVSDHFEVLDSGYHYHSFIWSSQSSQFLMWMFEKCLGLRPGETTTRNPIRADWLARTPTEFQIWFLQGLADSDGYVDLNKHEIGLVAEPNGSLIAAILANLGAYFRLATIKNQATVLLSVKEGFRLPIFSPYSRTHKFELAQKLANARRLQGPWPRWLRNEVNQLIDSGRSTGEVISTILEKHKIAIRSQHLRGRS